MEQITENDTLSSALPSTHPLSYEDDLWICPVTGWKVPKDLKSNLLTRKAILEMAKDNESVQIDLMNACAKSILLWVNLFVWTFNVKTVSADGKERPAEFEHAPFITWPVQDEAILQLVTAVDEGQDVIIDKSRDMGGSWLNVVLCDWLWLFRSNSHSLMVSRIEDLVDKKGNPDCLFWKIDYVNRRLPEWMLPGPTDDFQRDGKHRTHLQLTNIANGATISGQATTGHVGRGGRRTLVFFDEMAAIDHDTAAWQSAADTTACRIGNSTPLGLGTEFSKQRNFGLLTGKPKVITLGYWDHPLKGRGRILAVDSDGSLTGIAGLHYWETEWFKQECARRQDHNDIVQNILIQHHTAPGRMFFNSTITTQHIKNHAKQYVRCEINEAAAKGDKKAWSFVEDSEHGRWYVWIDKEEGIIKPSEYAHYVGFVDLSYGKGEANSVAAFMNVNTGEIVAEFVDPYISIHDLADEVSKAGRHLFCGSNKMAFLGWETNGPGTDWERDLRRNNYTSLYFQRQEGSAGKKRTRKYGWHSDRNNKRRLLQGLSRALCHGEIEIHSKIGLQECLEYAFLKDGSIGPSKTLRGNSMEDEPSGARESHGDRVIAYAGCVLMRAEVAQYEELQENFDKPGTFGHWLDMDDTFKDIRSGRYQE